MRQGTVCFLRKKDHLLLAQIEYSATEMKWTGLGGFIEAGESTQDAVVREITEETHLAVDKNSLVKVAEIIGTIQLHVFTATKWTGDLEIKDPSIKKLQWFRIHQLPYPLMHPETEKWLPNVLEGNMVKFTNDQLILFNTFD